MVIGGIVWIRGAATGESNIHGNWRGPDRHRRDLIGQGQLAEGTLCSEGGTFSHV